jgi:hypothetical protein
MWQGALECAPCIALAATASKPSRRAASAVAVTLIKARLSLYRLTMGLCLSTSKTRKDSPQLLLPRAVQDCCYPDPISPRPTPTPRLPPKRIPKSCTHDHCSLTISTCCLCTDKRPPGYRDDGGGFQRYVDGVGYLNDASREEYYCPECKQFLATKTGEELFDMICVGQTGIRSPPYKGSDDLPGPSNPPTYLESVS